MDKQLLFDLKENNEDFEFYPTTKIMIYQIYNHMKRYRNDIHKILDIGCGTCNFHKYVREFNEDGGLGGYTYYVMEKSKILIDNLPNDAIVLGTDFNQNILIDKIVDCIFCNPPYSEYEVWTQRILKESTAKFIYMVIPQRWKDNKEIMQVIKDNRIVYNILASDDFINAERSARAKVDIIFFDKRNTEKNKAFNDWFDSTFELKSTEIKEEDELKDKLVAGKNKVEILVNSYNDHLKILYHHFSSICSLEEDILMSIGVDKSKVKESLKSKIQGLKNRYWYLAFDELKEITSRLTNKTKEKLLDKFKGILTVDFTSENIYSLIVWVCKNASDYYDEQLIELYKDFTSPENISKYKSNQIVFNHDSWWRDRDSFTHYCLTYRIICDKLYFRSSYSWDNEIDKFKTQTIISDLCAIAHNLGFNIYKSDIPQVFGIKYYIWKNEKEPLMEFKLYQNGNTHIKLDKEFNKAMNVEVARLLGWIRSKEDITKEFPEELAKGAEKYFDCNKKIAISDTRFLLS